MGLVGISNQSQYGSGPKRAAKNSINTPKSDHSYMRRR